MSQKKLSPSHWQQVSVRKQTVNSEILTESITQTAFYVQSLNVTFQINTHFIWITCLHFIGLLKCFSIVCGNKSESAKQHFASLLFMHSVVLCKFGCTFKPWLNTWSVIVALISSEITALGLPLLLLFPDTLLSPPTCSLPSILKKKQKQTNEEQSLSQVTCVDFQL